MQTNTQNTQSENADAVNLAGTMTRDGDEIVLRIPVPSLDALKANTKGRPFVTCTFPGQSVGVVLEGHPITFTVPSVNMQGREREPGTSPATNAKRRFTFGAKAK